MHVLARQAVAQLVAERAAGEGGSGIEQALHVLAVAAAGGWVRSQSGWPKPVRVPAMSNTSLAAKMVPSSGPSAAPASETGLSRTKAPSVSFMAAATLQVHA